MRGRGSGLEWGVNAGGGVSWKGSDTEFAGKVDESGGTIAFRIDNEMLILEGHIGGKVTHDLGLGQAIGQQRSAGPTSLHVQ